MDASEDVGLFSAIRQGGTSVSEVYTVAMVAVTFILPGVMIMISIQELVFFDMGCEDLSCPNRKRNWHGFNATSNDVSVQRWHSANSTSNDDNTRRLLSDCLDWYEFVLLLASLVALVLLWRSLRRSTSTSGSDMTRFLTMCGTDRGFFILICLFAVASLLNPTFKAVATATCFRTDSSVIARVRFARYVLTVIFLIAQALVLIVYKRHECRTKRAMFCVVVLVSMNACLCIRCFSEAVHQTMLNNNSNDTKTAYGAAFCHNQGSSITEGFRVVDKYFYTMVLFYSLYSIEVLCSMSNLLGRRATSIQAAVEESLGNISSGDLGNTGPRSLGQHASLRRSNSTMWARNWTRIKSIYCVGLCKYSFLPTAIGCLILILAHVILDVKMREFDSPRNGTVFQKDTTFVWIQTIYENFMTGAAFVGLLFVLKERLNPSKLYGKHILLIAATCVFAVLIALECLDAIENMVNHPRIEEICLFLFRTLFHFLGLLFQTPFILKSSSLSGIQPGTNRYHYVRGLLWFLAFTNLERSLVDTFLTPIVLRYASNIADDFFTRNNWAIVTRIVFPVTAVYRLQSSLLCFETLWKTSEAGRTGGGQRRLDVNTRASGYGSLFHDVVA